jgi:hypothetical protein
MSYGASNRGGANEGILAWKGYRYADNYLWKKVKEDITC